MKAPPLPAVLAARLLGYDTEDLETLVRLGLVAHERRGWRNGGLVVVPALLVAS